MTKQKILVVDDDERILTCLEGLLSRNGYEVLAVSNGHHVFSHFEQYSPDLLVLDIMMPDIDGYEICQRIRESSDVPIMFLSAKGEPTDRVLGLALGCDDYLSKPFDNFELLLRIKAVLRRINQSSKENRFVIKRGNLTMDKVSRELWINQTKIELTKKEFDLLWLLASQPHKVFTRENLVYAIWGTEFCEDTKIVTAIIKRLREKIEFNPNQPLYIKTIRGVGYKFGLETTDQYN